MEELIWDHFRGISNKVAMEISVPPRSRFTWRDSPLPHLWPMCFLPRHQKTLNLLKFSSSFFFLALPFFARECTYTATFRRELRIGPRASYQTMSTGEISGSSIASLAQLHGPPWRSPPHHLRLKLSGKPLSITFKPVSQKLPHVCTWKITHRRKNSLE